MNPRTAYREDTVRGAHPVRLVVLLYEQIIEDVRQAALAIEQNQVERRTHKINHAISVIAYLESSLNHQAGAQVAGNLENFYRQLRRNLVQAHVSASPAILSQQITDLLTLRAAWSQVESEVKVAEAAARNVKPVPAAAASDAARGRSKWQG